ncbi:hypothetical protein [Lentilactobacillus senioris]|uniref:hypothetical protein n=1 Tax=Lentilactobacillus senioris TaxID=931534 RepID=UPI0006D19A0A|nr:hypothetical protein [Lentilactobacillus senioris]
MKFRKYLLPTLLTIAVLLSLALSVAMWLNPARYGSRQQNNTKTPPLKLNRLISPLATFIARFKRCMLIKMVTKSY